MLYTRWSRLQSNLAIFLTPLSWIFGFCLKVRHYAYDQGWLPQYRPKAFTISIGGIEAGGSGKTPITAYMLQKLRHENKHVGLLSRGYGRSSRGLICRQKGEKASAAKHGDEPTLILNRYADVPAAICAKRSLGAKYLSDLGCANILCDDAFSHRALHRDLDIVVLRGEAPIADGHLLPRGHLREPLGSLKRAHMIWLHYKSAQIKPTIPPELSHLFAGKPLVRSTSRLILKQPDGSLVQSCGQDVVAAAGIAHPQSFHHMLKELDLNVLDFLAFADHCTYHAQERQKLQESLAKHQGATLVVTAKDYVKLAEKWPPTQIWIADLEVCIFEGEEDLDNLLKTAP
jgi:tetraacyldisaccharide 4'-kinase